MQEPAELIISLRPPTATRLCGSSRGRGAVWIPASGPRSFAHNTRRRWRRVTRSYRLGNFCNRRSDTVDEDLWRRAAVRDGLRQHRKTGHYQHHRRYSHPSKRNAPPKSKAVPTLYTSSLLMPPNMPQLFKNAGTESKFHVDILICRYPDALPTRANDTAANMLHTTPNVDVAHLQRSGTLNVPLLCRSATSTCDFHQCEG